MNRYFYLISLLFFFTSCSKKPVVIQEEKVEKKIINQIAKDYRDVTEQKAIDLLVSKELSDDEIYNKIKSDKSPLFSWYKFWGKVREGNIYLNINIKKVKVLNRLSTLDCENSSSSSFLSTAAQVLNSTSGKSSLSDLRIAMVRGVNTNLQRCNSKASNHELTSIITSYKDMIRNNKSDIIIRDFLQFINLVKRNNEHRQFVNTLEGVLVTDWNVLSKQVLRLNDARLLLDFLDAYKNVNPYARSFCIQLIESFLGNDISLAKLREKLETHEIAEVLTRYYGNNLGLGANTSRRSLSKDVQSLIDLFKKDFSKVGFGDDVSVLIERAFVSYLTLKKLMELDQNEDFAEKISLFDRLTREMENILNQAQKQSLDFLDYQSDNNLSAIWLKIRMNLKIHGELPYIHNNVSRMVALSNIDKVLQSRSLLYLEKNEVKLKEKIESHCKLLEEVGISSEFKAVSTAEKLKIEIESFLLAGKPGCLKIPSLGKYVDVNIENTNLEIKTSFDHIVIAQDVNIEFNIGSVDGPIFDLSANQKHQNLTYSEETKIKWRKEADAIVIPIIFGIDTNNISNVRHPFKRNSRHYILYYYSARPAMNSCVYGENRLCSGTQPQKGFSGGNLNISTSNKRDTMPIKFLSKGGEGQESPQPLPPGEGVELELDISEFEDILPSIGLKKNILPKMRSNSALKHLLYGDNKPDIIYLEEFFNDIDDLYIDSELLEQIKSQLELFSEFKGVCQNNNYNCIYKYASDMAYKKLFYEELLESPDHILIESLVSDEFYEEFEGRQLPKTKNGPPGDTGSCNGENVRTICK